MNEENLERNSMILLENTIDAIDAMFNRFENITPDNEKTIMRALSGLVSAIIGVRYGQEELTSIYEHASQASQNPQPELLQFIDEVFNYIDTKEDSSNEDA